MPRTVLEAVQDGGEMQRIAGKLMSGKRRKIAGVFFWAALILSAAGCGNPALHDNLEDKGQTVIRVAWWGGEERHNITEQVLALYAEEHPGIVFETQSYTWDDYFGILSLKAAQGEMPDLIQMDYQYITTYSENGSLADLTSFLEDGTIRTEDMEEAILKGGMVDGRMTGIVLGTSILSVICNPEVFAEAGIPVPDQDWTWEDYMDICVRIQEKTGKYGAAMTPVLDMNLYHYWLRQHGEELFSSDGLSLGYDNDSLYVGYMEMFKSLMEQGAFPDSDSWAAINVRGPELFPVITGEGAMMQEWNNFPVRMSYVKEGLKMVTPPLLPADGEGAGAEALDGSQGEVEGAGAEAPDSSQGEVEGAGAEVPDGSLGLWLKPGMFFSVAETSCVKKECAQFIDWFLNSEEANAILQGERGIPVSGKVRESLYENETVPEAVREMLRFSEEAMELCGDTPPPEPAGIDGINEAFAETANRYFYGMASAEEAAEEFRRRANEILQSHH